MSLSSKICREKPTLINLVSFNSKQYNTLLHSYMHPTHTHTTTPGLVYNSSDNYMFPWILAIYISDRIQSQIPLQMDL